MRKTQVYANPSTGKIFSNDLEGVKRSVFPVAEESEVFTGFIIGEIRAWEFGSPPCGWIFALGVDPDSRTKGIGTRLFEAICERFQQEGIQKSGRCWQGMIIST